MSARRMFSASRIRILRLALREAYIAGDTEAVKRLTKKLVVLIGT